VANNKKIVLITDDEEDLTWSISRSLKRDKKSIKILCANSGYECIKILKKYPVHLLVTDLRMPGTDGYAVIKYIEDHYLPTKVIVMTAYGSAEVKDNTLKHGCCFYIEKPFEISALKEKIYSILKNQDFNGSNGINLEIDKKEINKKDQLLS
jgi:DNA-binding NtrC family response regulator